MVEFYSLKYGRTFNLVLVKLMLRDQFKLSKVIHIFRFNTDGHIKSNMILFFCSYTNNIIAVDIFSEHLTGEKQKTKTILFF